ncbi:MAG: porphobilinogen synthase [Thermoproteota archaeon]|jgi:porphobilinogen synthase|nr:porphobilinogen synthase [Thermoproteota archaeon]
MKINNPNNSKKNSKIYPANQSPSFPIVRLRRLRKTPAIRDLLQETRLSVADLVCPIFVQEGITKPESIMSMPDIQRIPLSDLVNIVDRVLKSGIKALILFGIPQLKDKRARTAYKQDGIVQQSVETIRKHFSDKIVIMTDVCLCQYTTEGHCGIMVGKRVANDESIKILAKVALSHAYAGADIVAPSAMMDGQVAEIRTSLDRGGFKDVAIMGYSAKHASPMYAPFRDAAHSSPLLGDRKTYQMPFTNSREAIREIQADINEGVDMVMIKPALPYLDLIYQARKHTNLPICAYSVSGEYALVKAAAAEGWVDEAAVIVELLTSIKRAGADMIITYHAMKASEILSNKNVEVG